MNLLFFHSQQGLKNITPRFFNSFFNRVLRDHTMSMKGTWCGRGATTHSNSSVRTFIISSNFRGRALKSSRTSVSQPNTSCSSRVAPRIASVRGSSVSSMSYQTALFRRRCGSYHRTRKKDHRRSSSRPIGSSDSCRRCGSYHRTRKKDS